jgi:hypothetical protein
MSLCKLVVISTDPGDKWLFRGYSLKVLGNRVKRRQCKEISIVRVPAISSQCEQASRSFLKTAAAMPRI